MCSSIQVIQCLCPYFICVGFYFSGLPLLTNICGLCCALGLGSLEVNRDAPGLSNVEAFDRELNQVADDWEREKEEILTKAGLSRSVFQEVKVLLLSLSS